jgi:ParB-like chromosome segregation protein Spo0J
MHVEMRPIDSIRPYANNPRLNDAAVDAVAASIQAFGFRQPIVVDEQGVIIVGHTRYKAALKLGLTEVPVHVAIGLTPAQAKAYRIADNQTAQLSGWDEDKLPLELAGLQAMGFDLPLTGFGADELLRLLGSESTEGLTDPDDIPEPPDEAITQPGDRMLPWSRMGRSLRVQWDVSGRSDVATRNRPTQHGDACGPAHLSKDSSRGGPLGDLRSGAVAEAFVMDMASR